jgi:hypothetical protein
MSYEELDRGRVAGRLQASPAAGLMTRSGLRRLSPQRGDGRVTWSITSVSTLAWPRAFSKRR